MLWLIIGIMIGGTMGALIMGILMMGKKEEPKPPLPESLESPLGKKPKDPLAL